MSLGGVAASTRAAGRVSVRRTDSRPPAGIPPNGMIGCSETLPATTRSIYRGAAVYELSASDLYHKLSHCANGSSPVSCPPGALRAARENLRLWMVDSRGARRKMPGRDAGRARTLRGQRAFTRRDRLRRSGRSKIWCSCALGSKLAGPYSCRSLTKTQCPRRVRRLRQSDRRSKRHARGRGQGCRYEQRLRPRPPASTCGHCRCLRRTTPVAATGARGR
jgi:hypothetical protein